MRTRPSICAVVAGAALIPPAPSMAQATDPRPAADVKPAKADPTPLSGVDVVAKRPTPLSGVEVVARRATPVSGVTVTPSKCPKAAKPAGGDIPPPKLVSSYPARGAVVRPGLVIVRLTFDRPMTCDGLLETYAPLKDPCPAPLHDPMISRDRRTFLTICKIDPNSHYALWLDNFTSLAGHPLKPYELVFETSSDREVATVDEAVAEDQWLKPPEGPKS